MITESQLQFAEYELATLTTESMYERLLGNHARADRFDRIIESFIPLIPNGKKIVDEAIERVKRSRLS